MLSIYKRHDLTEQQSFCPSRTAAFSEKQSFSFVFVGCTSLAEISQVFEARDVDSHKVRRLMSFDFGDVRRWIEREWTEGDRVQWRSVVVLMRGGEVVRPCYIVDFFFTVRL